MTENSEKLTRKPLKRTAAKDFYQGKSSDEIMGAEENESPSKVNHELSNSDESKDIIKNHRQEQIQLQLGNEEKIETNIRKGKLIQSSPSETNRESYTEVHRVKQIRKVIQSSPSETNISCLSGILVIFLVAIIAILYFTVASDSVVTEPLTANKVVKALQQKFSGQSDLSLKIIKKSINKIINGTDPEPTQPSVLLLMSSKGANEIGSCFARELARLISLPQTNYLTIDGQVLKDTDTDVAKKLIDSKIKSACDKQKPAVVLLQDLDMLPGSSANILFSYCDHENAPCKKAVFIMTISAREVIPKSADSKVFDRLADTHLRQSWHHVSDDLLSPLLSRITVSVAGIIADKPSK